MARKPRIEFPGALYHVIARGNHRQTLFHDEADLTLYLDRLEHYRQRYHLTLYATWSVRVEWGEDQGDGKAVAERPVGDKSAVSPICRQAGLKD